MLCASSGTLQAEVLQPLVNHGRLIAVSSISSALKRLHVDHEGC
jgi:hypothetical protein